MESDAVTRKKTTIELQCGGKDVVVSSDFDSGNLNSALVDLQLDQIQLTFGKDKEIKPSSKCWFYFSLRSSSDPFNVKLRLLKVNTLSTAAKVYDLYRPVLREDGGQWERYGSPLQFQISAEGDISFRMSVQIGNNKTVQIALCYPWSVADNQRYLFQLQNKLRLRQDIYFNKQTLILSPQGRPIHLLALSSKIASQAISPYQPHLYPNRQVENHFKEIHKPLILITSRVHPGEIGASYALNGMIDFLVSGEEEANAILDQFYFLIVPMLNPDGVFNGNNRMDALGQNLNRFYHLPDIVMQPSCYAIKTLIENTRQELYAFFDLHGHANKKSCFLFGNSINQQKMQIQSVLFAKYLSTICEYIEFKSCNFSKKQMFSKDKNQDLSKEGCARVVVHKWTNSPYCYTLQTGLFKNVKVDEKGISRYGQKFYCPQIYQEVGRKMLISLYRILRKSKEIDEMRKVVVDYVIKLEKINNGKKEKEKSMKMGLDKEKRSIKSIKDVKEEQSSSVSSTSQIRSSAKLIKPLQERQNDPKIQKYKEIESILQKNKNYLLNCNDDDDDE